MAEGGWQTYHVLFAKADNGTGAVTCQLGDVVTGEVAEPNAIMFAGGFGDISLPAPPQPGVAAAEVIALDTTWGKVIVGARSVRSAAIASLVKMGEKAVYADGSQAVMLQKLDGSINLLTTHDNTPTGRNVNFRVAPDGLKFEWPWSRLKNDSSGFHWDHVSGALFDISQVTLTGPFAVLSQFKTLFTLRADMGRIETTFMSVGPKVAIKSPLARADATLAALTAIQAQLTALTAAVTALAATPAATGVAPGTTGVVTAALGALTTTATTLNTLLTTVAVGTVPLPVPMGTKSLAAS